MEEQIKNNKLTEGAWSRMKPNANMKPVIRFKVDEPQIIYFPENFTEPEEIKSKDAKGIPTGAVFLRFDVLQDEEEKIIFSSAETLLQNLKNHEPLADKTFRITKKTEGTRQFFEVVEILNE